MKIFSKITLIAALAFALIACGEKEDETQDAKQKFLQITEKTIENYDGGEISGVQKATFEYADPNDVFWTKAVWTDDSANVERIIERTLDEEGFPIKEIEKMEDGTATEECEVEYCKKCYELLVKTEVKDGKKAYQEKYTYDDGKLVEKRITKFCLDSGFVNEDDTNIEYEYVYGFLPAKETRPKGNWEIGAFPIQIRRYHVPDDCCKSGASKDCAKECGDKKDGEKAEDPEEKKSCGRLVYSLATELDENGFPTYFKTTEPECDAEPSEEWYKIERDGLGDVVEIIGFSNEEMTEHTPQNAKTVLVYDDQKRIAKVENLKYNEETGEFDRLHGMEKYVWIDSPIEGPKNYATASTTNRHQCYHREMVTVTEKKVENFDETGKTIKVYKSSFPLGEAEEPKPELDKVYKKKFKVIEK